jgi:hypothetical protein
MATAFAYPDEPHRRKHGPLGYADYRPYRPWLRDEFQFRCVYCLTREQWGRAKGMFDLDHFVPQAHDPEQRAQYDNLLYACTTCNRAKSDQTTPDPTQVLTAEQVQVHSDGSIDGVTPEAERLIWLLDLDGDDYRQWRLVWMRIIELAEQHDCDLYRQLMGFPRDLPNLRQLRPPGGNSRPEGIENSFYEMRRRGQLSDEY